MFSPLRPLRFAAPTSAGKSFVPYGGMTIKGRNYQAGEELTEDDLADLTPLERQKLTRNQVHGNYEQASKDFAGKPTFTQKEREGDPDKGIPPRPVPVVGDRRRQPHDDPLLVAPRRKRSNTAPKTAEEGRQNLPPEVRDPKLLLDEEAELISSQAARDFVHYWNTSLSTTGLKAAAQTGRVQRGWYKGAANALLNLFGPTETPRFVALLGATSPKVSVENNLKKSLIIWKEYQEWRANRKSNTPPTEQEVAAMLPKWNAVVKATLPEASMEMHNNNIVRALANADPVLVAKRVLSGPKVDNFRRNLLGMLEHVTNDSWEAALMGVPQSDIGGKTKKGVRIPNAAYIALSVKHRKVAEQLNANLKPGEQPWSPAEVQETAWSFIRALAHVGARSRDEGRVPLDPIQVLSVITHEDVAAGTDFIAKLLNDPSNVDALKQLGLGKALSRVRSSYKKHKAQMAKTHPGLAVPHDLSGTERAGLEEAARNAGHQVNAFMAAIGKSRFQRRLTPLRFAAPQQMQAMPQPAAPPAQAPGMPAMPQAQNPVQAPMQPTQLPPIDEHRENMLAFSPNVDDLSFEDALARTRSGNQKAFKKIISHIGEQIGVKPQTHDAVGDWSDGAENSLLQYFKEPLSADTLDYIGAWYGLLANQKSVLRFQPQHGGLDSVYEIEIPNSDLGQIRKSLDKAGIAFRTLIPTKKGTKVVLYDEKRELRDQVAAWAGQHNAVIRESIGQGRYIGGPTRTAARREYRKIITAYEAAAAATGGQVRAYKPPVKPSHLRTAKDRQTQIKQAKAGRPIRFASGPLSNPNRLPPPPVPQPEPQETGFVRNPEAPVQPSDVRSGLSFGLDWTSQQALRRLYRAVKGRSDEAGKIARELIRQAWRGDVWAVHPAFDAVADAGGEAVVQEMNKEGLTPDFIHERLVKLGNGPRAQRKRANNQEFENDFLSRNEPLSHLAEDQDMAPAEKPTLGERLTSLGRGVKRVAKKVGTAALRQLPKETLPKKTRQSLYGWESYVKKHNLPREEVPNYGKDLPPVKPVKMSGVHAPAGGVVVRGLFYPGGKWIPSAKLEKASYEQYQHVENQRMKKYRREDGSVSVEPALASEGAKQFSKGNYTPGVDPRVEKIRAALGRGGHPTPPSTPVKPATGRIGSGLRK